MTFDNLTGTGGFFLTRRLAMAQKLFWSIQTGHFFLSKLLIERGIEPLIGCIILVKVVVADIVANSCFIPASVGRGTSSSYCMSQAVSEALHDRIIPAGLHISRAASEPIALQHRLEAVAGILQATVSVHHKPAGRVAVFISAWQTRDDVMLLSTCRPTIRRECRSMTAARYTQPSPVY